MPKDYVTARSRREMYAPDYQSVCSYVDESGESFVQQSDYDRSDINLIVERFIKTGILESVKQTNGFYGDFSEITDYHSALQMVQHAEESFMTLPATLRARFDNDPGAFLDFVSNPANEQEMAELGLLNEEATARYIERRISQQAVSDGTQPAQDGQAEP